MTVDEFVEKYIEAILNLNSNVSKYTKTETKDKIIWELKK